MKVEEKANHGWAVDFDANGEILWISLVPTP